MFNCGFCGNLTQAGEPGKLVVVAWRKKVYPSAELPRLPGTTERRFSGAGEGFEVAEERRACKTCVKPDAPTPSERRIAIAA